MTHRIFARPATSGLLAGLLCFSALTGSASAATGDWTDATGNGLWGDAGNWSGVVPAENDTAHFGPGPPAGFNIDLGGVNRPVGDLFFSGVTDFTLDNGTLQFVGRRLSATGLGTYTVNGEVSFNSQPFSPIPGFAVVHIGPNANVVLASGINDTGFFSLRKTGDGVLTLSSPNTFAQLTQVNEGTIRLGHADALQNSTIIINVDGGLDITTLGVDAQLGGLGGPGNFDLGAQHLSLEQGDFAGVLSGTGSLTKRIGADLRLAGANTYAGGTTITGGRFFVSNTTGSGTGIGPVVLEGGSILGGFGTIAGQVNIERFADVAPGELDDEAVGILTVHNIEFERGADLILEIGGLQAGTEHDQLRVTGDLLFGNVDEIEVNLIDEFDPTIGDRFLVLDVAGTVTGAFQRTDLPTLDAGEAWNLQDLYTTGELRIDLLGDLDTDGFVGAADLDILLANWGTDVNVFDFAAGDATGDGVVGQDDLQIVLDQFGSGTPAGNVPEPGSLAAFALSGIVLMRRRRRQP